MANPSRKARRGGEHDDLAGATIRYKLELEGHMMLQRVVAAGVLFLASAVVSNAQSEATSSSPAPKVEASHARSVYKVGEPVEVTVTLENAGMESFYVRKELGGGFDDIGFEVYLLRNGEPYCRGSPVQLLHEET
jgi:uncharacterized protein (DUF58 family)